MLGFILFKFYFVVVLDCIPFTTMLLQYIGAIIRNNNNNADDED
jgi:hypothetical protein